MRRQPRVRAASFGALVGATLLATACGGGSSNGPVSPPPVRLTITTLSLPKGQVNTAYDTNVTAVGGSAPYTWALANGGLPAGLSLNLSTGQIDGTPTQAGSASFTLLVRDSSSPMQTATAPFSIAVAGTSLALSAVATPNTQYHTTDLTVIAAFGGWSTALSGTLTFSDNGQAITAYDINSGTSGVYSIVLPNLYPATHVISGQFTSSSVPGGIAASVAIPGPAVSAIPVPPPNSAYIGVAVKDKNGGVGVPTSVSELSVSLGRPVVFDLEYPLFTDEPTELWTDPSGYSGDVGWPEAIAADFASGFVPIISWSCAPPAPAPPAPRTFFVASIAEGAADAYLDAIAHGLIALSGEGNRVMLRWCYEGNLPQHIPEFQATTEAGRAAEYIAAFQHIVMRIRNDFADSSTNPNAYRLNVAFSFNMSGITDGTTAHPVGDIYYPGDEFVDWIAIDKYNTTGVATLDQVNAFITATPEVSNPLYPGPYPGFYPTYTNSISGAVLPVYPMLGYDRPLMIGETGAPYCEPTSTPPSCIETQAQYINSAAAEISGTASGALGTYNFPMVRILDYFSSTGPNNSWELDGGLPGNGGYQAFANMACSKPFLVSPAGNNVSTLTCQ